MFRETEFLLNVKDIDAHYNEAYRVHRDNYSVDPTPQLGYVPFAAFSEVGMLVQIVSLREERLF